jgi:hypothetical protein
MCIRGLTSECFQMSRVFFSLDDLAGFNAVDAEGWSPLILASKVWHAISLSARNPRQITQQFLSARNPRQGSGLRVKGSGFRV